MADATDNSNVIIRPPAAWGLAFIAGLGLDWIYPLAFLPAGVPRVWVGAAVFAVALVLAVSAIISFRKGETPVQTYKPTRGIVTRGRYRITRNPIYIGMFLGQTGLAIGFDNLWMLIALVPFFLVIRFGVVAREEAYLERKFGESYLSYKKRVGRWI